MAKMTEPLTLEAPLQPGLEAAIAAWMNDPANRPPGSGPEGGVIAADVWAFTISMIRTLLLTAANLAIRSESAGLAITDADFGQQAIDLYHFLQNRRAPQGATA